LSKWYESFFDALANEVWRGLVPAAASDAEVDALIRRLAVVPTDGARVLDLACGEGRISTRLAERGCTVTGVDISADAVAALREVAHERDLAVEVIEGDLRRLAALLPAEAVFDAGCCMGNSFAYLAPDDTRRMLEAVAAALRPGARLVVDDMMAAECVLPGYRPTTEPTRYDGDGVFLEVVDTYDVATSTMVATMTLGSGTTTAVREARHRVTTVRETVAVLDECGFDVVALESGTDGTAFEVGAGGLVVVAERRSSP